MSCCAPWTAPSPSKPSSSSPQRKRSGGATSPSSLRCSHRAEPSGNSSSSGAMPARLVIHDALDAAGVDTKLARAAREGFCHQIGRMNSVSAETSIAVSKEPDLVRAALQIAAEDDSLVSQPSVLLPVDAFISSLVDLSMGFCFRHMPPPHSPPELFLGNLERYFYVHKGFHRKNAISDARALYLHSVLTSRSGSAVMLSLIYSEMLKIIRVCGFLDFDVEIYFPHDLFSLPRGYQKQKSKLSDQPHIITTKSLLVEILRNLKDAFWPFQYDLSSSLFVRAAHATNHTNGLSLIRETYSKSYSNVGGFELASAKVPQNRLGAGVRTNIHFSDMRRALAACERLIILATDHKELRDYAVLLYHCGHYEECMQYLKLYQSSESNTRKESPSSPTDELEEEAVLKLIARVSLILGDEGWSTPTTGTSTKL